MNNYYDYVVFGAGFFGMHAAKFLAQKGLTVAIVDIDQGPFRRASYINQARLHNGYHYPRSVYTAQQIVTHKRRFMEEFSYAVNRSYTKIYGISAANSLTHADQFLRFCRHLGTRCDEVNPAQVFQPGAVEAAFMTDEPCFDSAKVRDGLLHDLQSYPGVHALYGKQLKRVQQESDRFRLDLDDRTLVTPRVLNATYSGINRINALFGFPLLNIKYELCEVILGVASSELSQLGITVMDGPFFSTMPFGDTGFHSLTSVVHTPHASYQGELPTFACQHVNMNCQPGALANCNTCAARPQSAWTHMNQLMKRYLRDGLCMDYERSLFTVKAVLAASEIDDTRPTLVTTFSSRPFFAAVLSGKLTSVYELELSLL